jgi:hypothetical protein
MKIIDEYLNKLYKNDKSKEIKELREELREHLITSSNEFISKGYSEEDAQREAINQFDGGTEMLKELHKTLKETKSINTKLNKIIRNIFRNISIISLVLVLSIVLYIDRLNDNIEFIDDNLTAKLDDIVFTKDIYNPKTYENELQQLLKTKEFKHVREFNIYLNAKPNNMGTPIYKYTDEKYKQNTYLARLSGNAMDMTSKGERASFEVGIDYRPIARSRDALIVTAFIGAICFLIYIVLLVRFKVKS